jgi:hypothetical protein
MSEYKEIDECVKELNGLYDKLHKRFCEWELCTECPLDEPFGDCLLITLGDLIDEL